MYRPDQASWTSLTAWRLRAKRVDGFAMRDRGRGLIHPAPASYAPFSPTQVLTEYEFSPNEAVRLRLLDLSVFQQQRLQPTGGVYLLAQVRQHLA